MLFTSVDLNTSSIGKPSRRLQSREGKHDTLRAITIDDRTMGLARGREGGGGRRTGGGRGRATSEYRLYRKQRARASRAYLSALYCGRSLGNEVRGEGGGGGGVETRLQKTVLPV